MEAAQEGSFSTVKSTIDVGDIVGASGGVKRTDRGESLMRWDGEG